MCLSLGLGEAGVGDESLIGWTVCGLSCGDAGKDGDGDVVAVVATRWGESIHHLQVHAVHLKQCKRSSLGDNHGRNVTPWLRTVGGMEGEGSNE